MAGSRRLMFGLARSIFSRRTCAPSGNSPSFMRWKRSRFCCHRAVAVGARSPRLGQRAAQAAHFFRGGAVDVGEPGLDEVPRVGIETVEIVGRMVEVGAPVIAQPAHRVLDRILVFDVFLDRVGVVEAQMAHAAVFCGQAEIQADRLGVADMQITVRLRRKASDHSPSVLVGVQILGNDLPKEIRTRRGARRLRHCSSHGILFMNKEASSRILTAGVGCVTGRYATRMGGMRRGPLAARVCGLCSAPHRTTLSTISVDKSVRIL